MTVGCFHFVTSVLGQSAQNYRDLFVAAALGCRHIIANNVCPYMVSKPAVPDYYIQL